MGEFVEDMSKKNIGRPSTYASVIETLMKKGWIEVDIDIFEIRLTPKGVHIADILETSGHAEASWQFSSKLEKSLSMVENGEIPLEDLIWLYTGIRIGV